MALLPTTLIVVIADRDRFVDRLLGDNSAHELRLGLDPAAGMAEDAADRTSPLQVLPCRAAIIALTRSSIAFRTAASSAEFGMAWQRHGRECKRAGGGEVTTGNAHLSSPSLICWIVRPETARPVGQSLLPPEAERQEGTLYWVLSLVPIPCAMCRTTWQSSQATVR